jgi:hypothetical protein
MRAVRLAVCVLVAVAITGCAGLSRQPAVPADLTTKAVVPGLEDVRYFADADIDELSKDAVDAFYREVAYLKSIGRKGPLPPAIYLALSGGGDNGAFGAGLLNGWTAHGDRPEFKVVTGVSTGALIAPFAFLGPAYDETIKRFYTTSSPKDILKKRSIFAAFNNDSMENNAPLHKTLAEAVTQEVLDAVAREYEEKGRLLLIATADLDAERSVLWNMGKIAASKDPKALELFRTVMIASTSIPGVFPPVMLDVEADGKPYQEMHVDGGTMAQVFVYPPVLDIKKLSERHHVERERTAYIIRNGFLVPKWKDVERQTLKIASRAVGSLVDTQGVGDLYEIYVETQRDGVGYNLAYIPDNFDAPHPEEFDTDYMRALFDTGYDLAVNGYPWKKQPPDF